MAETIVLTVDVDLQEGIRSVEELIQRQTDLRKSQIALRDEAKRLRKDIREANEAFEDTGQVADNYDELVQSLVEVENQLKDVGTAQRLVRKELEAAGTPEESFRRLTVEAKKLEDQLRRTAQTDAGFEDLRQKVRDANQAVIDFDQNANNFRSSVGRYSQGIISAFEQAGISVRDLDQKNLAKLQQRQKQLQEETRELAERYRNAGNIGEISLGKIEKQIEDNRVELAQVNDELAVTEKRLRTIAGIDLGRFAEGFAATFTAQAALDGLRSLISGTREYFNELVKIEDAAGKLFDSQAEDLDRLTSKVLATSKVFDQDYNEVLRAANVLSETFGGTGADNIDRINQLLIQGANLSGDFLDQVSEYSTFFAQAGTEAEDFLNLLVASENAGIFNDKAPDAIKEAFISIREGTEGTREALSGIGIDYEAEIQKINEGNQTFNDLLGNISNRLGELDTFSPEVGAVLADVFRGAGEDAGTFIQDLQKIQAELEATPDALTPYQRSQEALLELQEQLANAGQAVADALLPVIAETLELFTELGQFIGENSRTIGIFVGTITTAVVAQRGFNAISALNIKSLGDLTKGFKGFNAVLRENPIGVVITAFGLLATAVSVVRDNIDTARNIVDNFFDTIDGALARLGPFGAFIRKQFQLVRSGVNVVIDAIGNFQATLAGLRAGARAVLDNIVNGFQRFGNIVQLAFQQIRSTVNIGGIFGDQDKIDAEIQRLQSQGMEFAQAGQSVGEAYTTARNDFIRNNPIEDTPTNEGKAIQNATKSGQNVGKAFAKGVESEVKAAQSEISALESISNANQSSDNDLESLSNNLLNRANLLETNANAILTIERESQRARLAQQEEAQRQEAEALLEHEENKRAIYEESLELFNQVADLIFDTERDERRIANLDEEIERLQDLQGNEQRVVMLRAERAEAEERIIRQRERQEQVTQALANTEQLLESIRSFNNAREAVRSAAERIRAVQESGAQGIRAILKAAGSGGILGVLGLVAAIVSGVAAIRGIVRSFSADGSVLTVDEIASKGTVIRGRTHSRGGEPVVVRGRRGRTRAIEAEDSEIILTRGVFLNQNSRDAASALNELGGGRRLPGVSSNYRNVLQQVAGITGKITPRQTYPKTTRSPIMANGGILQGANISFDTEMLNRGFDRLGEKIDTNTEAVEETKIAIPVIETRRQLNNFVNYEASRRN